MHCKREKCPGDGPICPRSSEKEIPLLDSEEFRVEREVKRAKRKQGRLSETRATYWTDMNEELLKALQANNEVGVVIKLLAAGASCNATSVTSGVSALHMAASRGNTEVLALLLAEGANVNGIDVFGRSPLHMATLGHSVQAVDFLLKNGAEVNLSPGSPVKRGDVNFQKIDPRNQCLKTIVIKPLCALPQDHTALHTAVQVVDLECVERLLAEGGDVHLKDARGRTPMGWLGTINHDQDNEERFKKVALLMLNAGASLSSDGFWAAAKATLMGWTELLRWMLDQGVQIEALERDFTRSPPKTVLHLAAMKKDLATMSVLLEYECCKNAINVADNKGRTPIIVAAEKSSTECILLLLQNGADFKSPRTDFGHSLLHVASDRGLHDVVKTLISRNVEWCCESVVEKDCISRTCMHLAARAGCEESVKMLVNCLETCGHLGYNVRSALNEKDDDGWTPLHHGAYSGCRDTVEFLVLNGACLSEFTKGSVSAVTAILNRVPRGVNLLERLLDLHVKDNGMCPMDPRFEFHLDYSIFLCPSDSTRQTCVLKVMMEALTRHHQLKLLKHPLLETFVAFKCKLLKPFHKFSIFFAFLFVLTMTLYVIAVYAVENYDIANKGSFLISFRVALGLMSCLMLLRDWFSLTLILKKKLFEWSALYRLVPQLLCLIVSIADYSEVWVRDIMAIATLAVWTAFMNQTGSLPTSGNYAEMFNKVAYNLFKFIRVYACLIVGFTLSFHVLLKDSIPEFEHPWRAFVKTLVMWTGQIEYETISEHNLDPASAILMNLMLILFIFLAVVALMNLLVGLAVSDIQDLEREGHIMKLKKQVEFLWNLEEMLTSNTFHFLSISCRLKRYVYKKLMAPTQQVLPLRKLDRRFMPHLVDALLDIVHKRILAMKERNMNQEILSKLDKLIRKLFPDETSMESTSSNNDDLQWGSFDTEDSFDLSI